MGVESQSGVAWATTVSLALAIGAAAPLCARGAEPDPPAAIATTVQPVAPAPAQGVVEALYAAPTRPDRAGRILAAVEVDGRGPFRFILDTGANRSAVSARLVSELGLAPSAAGEIGLHGVTGSATLPSVDVAALRAGAFSYDPGPLPVLASAVFADADGILGVEGFHDLRIEVDFAEDRVSIARSTGRAPHSNYYRVPASNYRGLLLVDGRAGGVRVKAIIDTGAERTLGNAALHHALRDPADRRRTVESRVVGATEATYVGTSFLVSSLRIGDAMLSNLPVTFGDMHVFEVWGLTDEPALLIGMDLIGTLRKFAVDYRRWEVQIMPFGSKRPNVQRCGPTDFCRSRIPNKDET